MNPQQLHRLKEVVAECLMRLEQEGPVALQAMCEEHTRVSPHGRVGSCGLESSCVCESCFRSLDQETQHMLSATDKLKPIRHAASFVSALKLKAATSAPVPATEAFVRAQQRWRGALHRLARRAPPLSRTPSSSSL